MIDAAAHQGARIAGPQASARHRRIGRIVACAANALLLATVAADAGAQAWPTRTVRLIVGQPAGSGVDNTARLLAKELSDQWGQPAVVENRLGAGGTIAVESVANAPPDGYTLLFAAPPNLIIPAVVTTQEVRFDPVKDFAPIGRVAQAPYVIAVGAHVPARNVGELVELARARPGALTYTSLGPGSLTEFNMALLSKAAGIRMTPIEYKSLSNGIVDMIAGRVDVSVNDLEVMAPHAAAGKARLIGVLGSRRAPRAPDVPTVAEQGFPTTSIGLWYGLLAPAQTPPDVLARLHASYEAAMRSAELRERVAAFGYELLIDSPADFASVIRDDLSKARGQAGARAPAAAR